MRIYLSYGLPKILDVSNLITHSKNYKEIYSSEGIFRIQNDKMVQLIPEDKIIETFLLDNRKFMVDKGGMTQQKNIQTLPYEHSIHEIEHIEYRLTSKSIVSLNVLRNKNKVIDTYFLVKANNICNNIKNDIQGYIALLDIK